MKIAYLINQYPKVSHSFIRREIRALEAQGLEIARFAIRSRAEELVDPADLEEYRQTQYVLERGALRLLAATIVVAFSTPGRWLRSLMLALKIGWGSERGVPIHCIYFLEACWLKRAFKTAAITRVHAHFGTNSTAVAMLCHALGGPPYSFTVHGPEEFYKVNAIALPEKVARASFAIAISYFGRSQLWRWSSYESWQKVFVVRCGVDDRFLKGVKVSFPETPRWVCVGRLSEAKGHLLLIEAIAQLVKEGFACELNLVGDGDLRPNIEAAIANWGLEERVRILGWATSEQVREQILQSQLMVLPSFAEGLPVVLMEALACERPVVSTYVAGIPELVIPNYTGWLVPAGSLSHLTAALREALSTPKEQLHQMGKQGAELVAQQHNIASEAAKLAELFKREKNN